jgi:hypothetical protein
MPSEDLEARIRRLEDAEEIRNAIAQYGFLVDDLQPGTTDAQLEKFLDLWTDDLIDEHPDANGPGTNEVHHGKAELMKWLREGSQGVASVRPAFGVHEYFNPWIQVDGDRATAKYYTLGPGMAGPPGARRAFWTHGEYHNDYERVNGNWLIKHLRYRRSFNTTYEAGWHQVGWDRDLGERGRRAGLSPQHTKLIEASGERSKPGPGEGWRG